MIYITREEIDCERADAPHITWALAEKRAETRKIVRMVEGLPGSEWKDDDLREILSWLVDQVSGSE